MMCQPLTFIKEINISYFYRNDAKILQHCQECSQKVENTCEKIT